MAEWSKAADLSTSIHKLCWSNPREFEPRSHQHFFCSLTRVVWIGRLAASDEAEQAYIISQLSSGCRVPFLKNPGTPCSNRVVALKQLIAVRADETAQYVHVNGFIRDHRDAYTISITSKWRGSFVTVSLDWGIRESHINKASYVMHTHHPCIPSAIGR